MFTGGRAWNLKVWKHLRIIIHLKRQNNCNRQHEMRQQAGNFLPFLLWSRMDRLSMWSLDAFHLINYSSDWICPLESMLDCWSDDLPCWIFSNEQGHELDILNHNMLWLPRTMKPYMIWWIFLHSLLFREDDLNFLHAECFDRNYACQPIDYVGSFMQLYW